MSCVTFVSRCASVERLEPNCVKKGFMEGSTARVLDPQGPRPVSSIRRARV
jgi:hypothetical protein